MKRSGVQCVEREGWGEESGEEEEEKNLQGACGGWKTREVTPLGLEDQYYSCQHSLVATVCGHWSFSSHSLIHLGIWGLKCATIQGNSMVATYGRLVLVCLMSK